MTIWNERGDCDLMFSYSLFDCVCLIILLSAHLYSLLNIVMWNTVPYYYESLIF